MLSNREIAKLAIERTRRRNIERAQVDIAWYLVENGGKIIDVTKSDDDIQRWRLDDLAESVRWPDEMWLKPTNRTVRVIKEMKTLIDLMTLALDRQYVVESLWDDGIIKLLLLDEVYEGCFALFCKKSWSLEASNTLKQELLIFRGYANRLARIMETSWSSDSFKRGFGGFHTIEFNLKKRQEQIEQQWSQRIVDVNNHVALITERDAANRARYLAWLSHRIDEEYKRLKRTGPAYQEYLTTPEWTKTSQRKRQQAMWQCETCGHKGNLHVHHNFYKRIPHEWDQDLEVLCERCHKIRHGRL